MHAGLATTGASPRNGYLAVHAFLGLSSIHASILASLMSIIFFLPPGVARPQCLCDADASLDTMNPNRVLGDNAVTLEAKFGVGANGALRFLQSMLKCVFRPGMVDVTQAAHPAQA